MSQALDSPPRPFKRQRTEEGHDNSETDIQEDDTFWFPDGNIVLVSEERKAFRVHLGVLAMHCQFFKDMVNNAHADGTHVKLEDTSRHIFWLLSFIYTPNFFSPGSQTPYDQLDGMLRIGTKYMCDRLRDAVISHLTKIYPSDLDALDVKSPLIPSENIDNHSLLAISMARSNNVSEILPVAFCFATTLESSSIRELHPALTLEDERLIHIGHIYLIKALTKEAWSYASRSDPLCSKSQCETTRATVCRALSTISASSAIKALLEGVHPSRSIDLSNLLCKGCHRRWQAHEMAEYERIWNDLPLYFDLPPW